MIRSLLIFNIVLFSVCMGVSSKNDEEEGPVIPPTNCEVCKFLGTELKDRLIETGKSKEVIETGHGLDTKKKAVKYNKSELRLIEAMENPHVCDKILEYNVHKERKGSLRFAKGQSETFDTLHKLVNRGVKVTLDIPYELWNETSAEVAELHRNCYTLVEMYEETIEDWYYNHQEEDIVDFLCRKHVLKNDDQSCLDEVFVPKEEIEDKKEDKPSEKNKKKKKKNKGQKGEKGQKDEL